ncbi:MAG: class I SAM-dependent RNA methyltransferase [Alphaproteobacteria bacterium]|nr:class I SAM-dependent RNA methyltransferase [Alphaproteobacteria bacterium]
MTITDIGQGGDGIARRPDGAVVFIPLTVPGDVVRASVRMHPDGQNRGQIQEIVTPGVDRVTPPCSHFGVCGGCTLQHFSPPAYLDVKTRWLREVLSRAQISCPDIRPMMAIPAHTRRRSSFSVCRTAKDVIIGFNKRLSDEVVNISACQILHPDIMTLRERLKPYLMSLMTPRQTVDLMIQKVDHQVEMSVTGRLTINLTSQEILADMAHTLKISRINLRARDRDMFEPLLSLTPFQKRFGDLTVDLPPGTFLQASDEAEQILAEQVTRFAIGARHVADLFSGSGLFTGHLMSQVQSITAVDVDAPAISALTSRGIKAQVRNLFKDPLSPAELKRFDTVILDPPRAGASAQSSALALSSVSKVIYVSCSPTSFARDARVLTAGGYALKTIQPLDPFIWSAHTELVSVFEKKQA